MPTVRIQYKRFDCFKPQCEFHRPDVGEEFIGRCTLLHVDMKPLFEYKRTPNGPKKIQHLNCNSFQAKKEAS